MVCTAVFTHIAVCVCRVAVVFGVASSLSILGMVCGTVLAMFLAAPWLVAVVYGASSSSADLGMVRFYPCSCLRLPYNKCSLSGASSWATKPWNLSFLSNLKFFAAPRGAAVVRFIGRRHRRTFLDGTVFRRPLWGWSSPNVLLPRLSSCRSHCCSEMWWCSCIRRRKRVLSLNRAIVVH